MKTDELTKNKDFSKRMLSVKILKQKKDTRECMQNNTKIQTEHLCLIKMSMMMTHNNKKKSLNISTQKNMYRV